MTSSRVPTLLTLSEGNTDGHASASDEAVRNLMHFSAPLSMVDRPIPSAPRQDYRPRRPRSIQPRQRRVPRPAPHSRRPPARAPGRPTWPPLHPSARRQKKSMARFAVVNIKGIVSRRFAKPGGRGPLVAGLLRPRRKQLVHCEIQL